MALPSNSTQTLCDLTVGKQGKIVGYHNDALDMPTKMIEMGLLPNTSIKILHQAPFNGPLYIEFGDENNRLALRRSEAAYLLVEPC